jgi:hypothetical protein
VPKISRVTMRLIENQEIKPSNAPDVTRRGGAAPAGHLWDVGASKPGTDCGSTSNEASATPTLARPLYRGSNHNNGERSRAVESLKLTSGFRARYSAGLNSAQ